MHRFKVSILFTVAGARREAESTNAATSGIGENITVFISKHHDIQCFRRCYHASCQIVNQKFLIAQTRMLMDCLSYNSSEATISTWLNRVLGPYSDASRIPLSLSLQCHLTRCDCYTVYLLIGTNSHCIGSLFAQRRSLPPCGTTRQCS